MLIYSFISVLSTIPRKWSGYCHETRYLCLYMIQWKIDINYIKNQLSSILLHFDASADTTFQFYGAARPLTVAQ